MRHINRKTDPKVVGGLVQKKNNWTQTGGYYNTDQPFPVVDRKRPGEGYRHILKQKDIHRFIALLPDWNELSLGLNAIVLAPGRWGAFGYHTRGVVHVCAWEGDLWLPLTLKGHEAEREIIEKLRVPCEWKKDEVICKFNEETAKGHQLLATLLHEFGHHHDRMTSKNKLYADRGESYAIAYGKAYAEQIWISYQEEFGVF